MADNINKKAINSAVWLTMMGILSSICSFVTSALLGRLNPDLLGQYSLIISFINLVSTIVCMGGSVILSRYIIRENDVIIRSRLFFSYAYLTIVVFVIFGVILIIFPKLYNLFIGETEYNIKLFGIICMMPIYTAVTVVSYFLMAILESKISKIMGSMYTFGMCIICATLYLLGSDFLEENFVAIIFSVVLIMNIAALCIGIGYIERNKLLIVKKESLKPLIPAGAGIFVLCTLGQSILSYLYANVDKVFLAQLSGLGQLGYYQAIVQIVATVELIPSLLGNVTVPFFSAMIGSEASTYVKETYLKIEGKLILFIATAVFGLIAISCPILQMFGEGYVYYRDILIVMLAGRLLSSRGYLNTPMLVNMDKNVVRLFNSVLQVILQILLMVFLITKIGIYGAVIAKTITAVFAQLIPQLVVKKSEYHIGFSKQYMVAAASVIILIGVIIGFRLDSMLTFGASVVFYILFFIVAGYSIDDIRNIGMMILGHKEKKNGKYK